MAQQIINLGGAADDGTGDDLRSGGEKINDNFTELYGLSGSNNLQRLEVDLTATDIKNLGTGYTLLAGQGANTVIEVVSGYFILTAGATPFNVGGNLAFYTDAVITGNLTAANCINQSVDFISLFSRLQQIQIKTGTVDARNAPLVLKTSGANGTAGDGTAKVVVYYRVLDLS